MGCLCVHIDSLNSGSKCAATPLIGLGGIQADSENTLLRLYAVCVNSSFSLSYEKKNVKVTITAALVCEVGGRYEFFLVTQGPFIVADGYLLVAKH